MKQIYSSGALPPYAAAWGSLCVQPPAGREGGRKVNKKYRQLWILLFLCTLCMTGIAGAGIQASAKGYSYEIVFYAGNRGRFTGTAGVSVISSGGTR